MNTGVHPVYLNKIRFDGLSFILGARSGNMASICGERFVLDVRGRLGIVFKRGLFGIRKTLSSLRCFSINHRD